MGSIASHPKIPTIPTTVYVPVYPTTSSTSANTSANTGSATSASTSGSTSANAGAAAPSSNAADSSTAAGLQTKNLLDRSRGVLSTVLTGFRGVLNDTTTPQRKSLLGE